MTDIRQNLAQQTGYDGWGVFIVTDETMVPEKVGWEMMYNREQGFCDLVYNKWQYTVDAVIM